MKYDETMIHITDILCESNSMYSIILLDARSLNITLSGYRCFLDGKYILCLNTKDTISVHSGYYEAFNLRFQPYFYNINLNYDIIKLDIYNEMREKYGYPDFRLFRLRDNSYFGIISITSDEYDIAKLYLTRLKKDIDNSDTDIMWSCSARSNMIAILNIAESAFMGKQYGLDNKIIRYINDNLGKKITLSDLSSRFQTNRTTISNIIKEKTGYPPMKYILELRLNRSRSNLLFTKLPINVIAEEYGFSDPNYYIRAFKARFGKSPLQFRKDGFEDRIKNETVYQRRAELENTEMTVDDFCEYFKNGLGRAVILLKKQSDKTPFKEAIWNIFLKPDRERDYHRFFGIYEKEILDIFGDNNFTDKLCNALLDKLSTEVGYNSTIPLLILLGERKRIEAIMEERYQKAYNALVEYSKKEWDGEYYPPCASEYIQIIAAMGRVLKVGDKRVKEILSDIADLYDYCNTPVITRYHNWLYILWDGVGREHFFMLLDEIVSEHKHGAKIDIRKDLLYTKKPYECIPTIEEIKKYDSVNEQSLYLFANFHNASKETVLEVAKELINSTDVVKRNYYLNYFSYTNSPEDDPVEFPLDPSPLIKIAENENFEMKFDPHPTASYSILEILANMKHPKARELGLKLFYDNTLSNELRNYALEIRFGKNYVAEYDKADFVALMRSPMKFERNCMITILINNIRNNVEDTPTELVPYAFKNCGPGQRECLCKALIKNDLMPEELKTECLNDSNINIRNLFLI